MRPLISSVIVVRGVAHDVVRVWNRGGLAGELVVTKGDGDDIAARLRDGLQTSATTEDASEVDASSRR